MPNEIYGHSQNPSLLVERAFSKVAEDSMKGLSFVHPSMPIKACGFQLFENQWIGTILTPWMLSVIILPGPEQIWDDRKIGERIGLQLPYGNMIFFVGQLEGLGQYLSASLISPLDKQLSAEQGVNLAQDSLRLLLSLPVQDADSPANLGRRTLFSAKNIK